MRFDGNRHSLRRGDLRAGECGSPGRATHGSPIAIAIRLVGGALVMATRIMLGRSVSMGFRLRWDFAGTTMHGAGVREAEHRDHQQTAEGPVSRFDNARAGLHVKIIGRTDARVKSAHPVVVRRLSWTTLTTVQSARSSPPHEHRLHELPPHRGSVRLAHRPSPTGATPLAVGAEPCEPTTSSAPPSFGFGAGQVCTTSKPRARSLRVTDPS